MLNYHPYLIVCAVALASCSPSNRSDASSAASSTATADSENAVAHMPRMMDSANMPGMETMVASRSADSMRAQMRMMDSMSGNQLKAMVPMHRQMAATMLSSFDDAMQRMNMTADSNWTALRDSIRQDLIHMPELTAAQLKTGMPNHEVRLMRFMKMHADMMRNVKQ